MRSNASLDRLLASGNNGDNSGPMIKARVGLLRSRLRKGQQAFFEGVNKYRLCAFKARRQYGKTTTLATIALKRMCALPDHTIIFGTARLNLATEMVRKQDELVGVTRKAFTMNQEQVGRVTPCAPPGLQENGAHGVTRPATDWDCMGHPAFGSRQDVENEARLLSAIVAGAKPAIVAEQKELKIADTVSGREFKVLRPDDFAHLFESRRMEFRVYHSPGSYSRTKIVALTPGTVGETGDMIADEIARVKNWPEVWEAIEPISSSNAALRIILSSTPSPDDTSLAFEMLREPPGGEFLVKPEGNWFDSTFGIPVLRVTAWDAQADGVQMYDGITGEAISVEEHRNRYRDEESWERNYGVRDIISGTGAIGLLEVEAAQQRGKDTCFYINIRNDAHLKLAKERLAALLGAGPVGCGWDVATTTEQTSNPSSFTVMEKSGDQVITRLICTWKTDSDEVQEARARQLLEVIAKRPSGGPAEYLCIDATNERLFARRMQQQLRQNCKVELIIGSEKKPGTNEDVNMKTLLGTEYVTALQRGELDLPAHDYVKEDHRLVRRDSGHFVCSPASDGKHGDTFDSGKLAFHALKYSVAWAQWREDKKKRRPVRTGRGGRPHIERRRLTWPGGRPPSPW